jgi:ABC-type multidrug transport system fused ATPase/permease subunit
MNLSGTNRFFKISSTRNSWAYVLFTIYSCMLLTYFQIFPALTSTTVDAQFFSGQRRNDTAATTTTTTTTAPTSTPSSRDGLLSILRDPSILTTNLSSSVEKVVDVVEKRIDSRLQGIKTRLDEIAAIAIPAIVAAVAGIIGLAALIIAFIIFYWINGFRRGRRHKRNIVHLSEHVLRELKENSQLLDSVHSSSSSNNGNSNLSVQTVELSNSALKAVISSPFFWDVSFNAQYTMFKLDMAVDRYNRVLGGAAQLRESVILNKVDEQTASKVLRVYDAKIADYRQETICLSKQLKDLMEAKATTKDVGGAFKEA